MRIWIGMCALAAFAGAAQEAAALEVFATSIFSPVPDTDEDPLLSGLMKIDLATGQTTTFVEENPAVGFTSLADVAVGPHDGLVYVTTQLGGVFRFDPVTGDPLPGEANGQFAQLFGAGNGLLFADDGTLYVAEIGQTGSVAIFDTQGVRQATGPTGLDFPAGMALTPGGDLLVATGGIGAAGEVKSWDGQTVTTLIPQGQLGGVVDLLVLPSQGDFDGSGATDTADRQAWAQAYGVGDDSADGNGDGVVDAADYTLWRDNDGTEARLLTTDFFANNVASFALDGSDRQTLVAAVPPEIPAELPPDADFGSNFPSEIVVGPDGTLLLATLGLTRRPDNRAAIWEYNRDGTLVSSTPLVEGLPPISGIALAPASPASRSVPEPHTLAIALLTMAACRTGSRR